MRRVLSFKYALSGILASFKEEPNLKFHFFAAILIIALGLFFHISTSDWIALFLSIGMVISVELTNTAIESVVDSFTDKSHPSAKLAKDISAGAVLIVALSAFVVGVLVFLPYLSAFFGYS